MRAASPLSERVLLAGLALLALHVPLVPVSHTAERAALPDLLFCLVAVWMLRRPALLPPWLVVALGLAADLLLARPLGLGALGLLLAGEALRGRPPGLGAGFLLEWLRAAAIFAVVLAAMALALGLAFVDGPGAAALVRHWLATVLAYPVVALVVHAALGRGAPARA